MKNVANDRPKARTKQLVVKEVDDEVLIYDLKTDQAHCLNPSAAFIWRQCDGQTNVDEIARSLKQIDPALDERAVWHGLAELKRFDLLKVVPIKPRHIPGMTRREVMRHVGSAAFALPVILSIAAPTAAQTASQCACNTNNCRPAGCACTANVQCVNRCVANVCV